MAMKMLAKTYDPRQVEVPRYQEWLRRGYFRAPVDPDRTPFVIMLPLPNVTGELHIGHASTFSIQDVLIRWRRMQGRNALWQPGTDHAGIATQNVVERELAKDGLALQQLGRERFVERVWEWKRQYGSIIDEQLKRMGFSCDWDRYVFTLDPGYYDAVMEAFVRLFNQGLIYRGKRMVNWCPRDESAISDLEVEHVEVDTQLWHVRYPGAGGGPGIVIATITPPGPMALVSSCGSTGRWSSTSSPAAWTRRVTSVECASPGNTATATGRPIAMIPSTSARLPPASSKTIATRYAGWAVGWAAGVWRTRRSSTRGAGVD